MPAPGAKTSNSTLALDLYGLVVYLHASCHHDLLEGIRHEELSLSQLQLLEQIRTGRRPTIDQAARIMRVSRSAASLSVASLARRGLVKREPADHDYRSKLITITGRGQDVVKRLNAARMPPILAFTQTLTPDQRKKLQLALRPIAARSDIAAYRPQLEAV